MPVKFNWRKQYDTDRDRELSDLTAIDCPEDTRTIQDAPGTSMDEILMQYGIRDGSELPTQLEGAFIDPTYYGDFTEHPQTLSDAHELLRTADARFMALPAPMRARFDNSPFKLHSWVSDPKNWPEAIQIGLLSENQPDDKRNATASQQTVANNGDGGSTAAPQ